MQCFVLLIYEIFPKNMFTHFKGFELIVLEGKPVD